MNTNIIILILLVIAFNYFLIKRSKGKSNILVSENNARILKDKYKALDKDYPPKLRYISLIRDIYPDNEGVVENIHKHAIKNAMQNGETINLQFVIMSILMTQYKEQKRSELTRQEKANIWGAVLRVVDSNL